MDPSRSRSSTLTLKCLKFALLPLGSAARFGVFRGSAVCGFDGDLVLVCGAGWSLVSASSVGDDAVGVSGSVVAVSSSPLQELMSPMQTRSPISAEMTLCRANQFWLLAEGIELATCMTSRDTRRTSIRPRGLAAQSTASRRCQRGSKTALSAQPS